MANQGWWQGLAGAVHAVTDLFLPPAMHQPGFEENQLLRARAFIRVTLLILGGLIVLYIRWALTEGPLHPVSLTWAAYALLLLGNLILVRLSGRFHEVTVANNLLGLTMITALLVQTGGLHSALMPLFLIGVATTGNFGGVRSILIFLGGFAGVLTGVYLWQLHQPDVPADIHTRFGFLATAVLLAVLANLSAQSARTKTRHMLRGARDAAIKGRRNAEEARQASERTLAALRAAQAQMLLQEKMASLGSMVAGVAHEVNTPVGLAVTGASQLRVETQRTAALVADGKLRRAEFDDYLTTVEELAALIERNAQRAAELIQSFKDVAVDQSSDARRPFELKPYVQEVLASLSLHTRAAKHKVVLEIEEDITLDGYPGAMAQILTNLVINSVMHGYPDDRPGTISLQASVLPDDKVRIIYRDDGNGIPPHLWSRIFEPFFTTRRGNGGSGLGLHLLYSIVTVRLGGTVTVGAAPGGGAEFVLTLPRRAPESGIDVSQ